MTNGQEFDTIKSVISPILNKDKTAETLKVKFACRFVLFLYIIYYGREINEKIKYGKKKMD